MYATLELVELSAGQKSCMARVNMDHTQQNKNWFERIWSVFAIFKAYKGGLELKFV